MSETIEAHEVVDRLWELLYRVKAGESCLIVRNGVPEAQLLPYRGRIPQRTPGEHEGTAAGQSYMRGGRSVRCEAFRVKTAAWSVDDANQHP